MRCPSLQTIIRGYPCEKELILILSLTKYSPFQISMREVVKRKSGYKSALSGSYRVA